MTDRKESLEGILSTVGPRGVDKVGEVIAGVEMLVDGWQSGETASGTDVSAFAGDVSTVDVAASAGASKELLALSATLVETSPLFDVVSVVSASSGPEITSRFIAWASRALSTVCIVAALSALAQSIDSSVIGSVLTIDGTDSGELEAFMHSLIK